MILTIVTLVAVVLVLVVPLYVKFKEAQLILAGIHEGPVQGTVYSTNTITIIDRSCRQK